MTQDYLLLKINHSAFIINTVCVKKNKKRIKKRKKNEVNKATIDNKATLDIPLVLP